MILYDTQRSGNAWKVRLLASLLGIELTRKTLSIDKGELRTAHWKRLAPLGQVPLLQLPDGTHLAESMAILYYLAQDTSWWPGKAEDQVKVLTWLSFEQERHMKPLAQLRLHASLLKDRSADDPHMQAFAGEARDALEILERQLEAVGAKAWVAGLGYPTIADAALYPYTKLAPLAGIALQEYPHICAWLGGMEALEGYEPLFPGRPELTLSTAEIPIEG